MANTDFRVLDAAGAAYSGVGDAKIKYGSFIIANVESCTPAPSGTLFLTITQ